MTLPWQKILVVGATSGIGLEFSKQLLSLGGSVVAVGRRQDRLDDLVARSHGSKGEASGIVFDISQTDEIPAFTKRVTTQHPDIDCIFLNAGMQLVADFRKPLSVNMDQLTEEMKVNYLSPVSLTRSFLPFLQEQSQARQMHLIFTTSSLMSVPYPMAANYCASKAALHSFILSLREQLKQDPDHKNIQIGELIAPLVQTELHDKQPGWTSESSPGMPVKDFVSESIRGFASGKESVAVGPAKAVFEEFEAAKNQRVSVVWAAIKNNLGEKVHVVS